MLKPSDHQIDQYKGYQQALQDFAITELLAKISNYSNTERMHLKAQEAENLATVLIFQLIQSIDSQVVANYLNAIRSGSRDILPGLIRLKSTEPLIDLPNNFPYRVKTPHFLYGDRLRWLSVDFNVDWGTVIGRFYSFAPHLCCWDWCYLIWLSKNSPSAAWTSTDIAWEDDLEPMKQELVL